MTLNLILTSKDAVYMSGDFRLMSIPDQAALPDSYDTQKLIPVIRPGWAAMIAYMGIASAPPLMSDTGQWIVEQMDSIPLDGSFSEIWRRLLRLNVWLGRIRGDRRIALSVVGFSNQEPSMMLISNFLDLHGRVTEAGPQVRAYRRRCNQAAVHAIGTVRPDIFQRVRLERLLLASSSRRLVPHLIRQAVASINADVARRSEGWISEECVTGYLLRSGFAVIGAHGIPENAPCFPSWVRRDLEKGGVIGFEPGAQQEGKAAPVRWKATTTSIQKGTVVRVHEIANLGKPILNAARAHTDAPLPHLNYLLQHTQMPARGRPRRCARGERYEVVVLRGDDAIRIVKYTD